MRNLTRVRPAVENAAEAYAEQRALLANGAELADVMHQAACGSLAAGPLDGPLLDAFRVRLCSSG